MFAGKAGAYPSEAPFRRNLRTYGLKKFYNFDTSGQCYKNFYGLKLRFHNKLEHLLLASFSSLVLCLQVMQEPTQVKYLAGAPL
jgi:hypothetical protein